MIIVTAEVTSYIHSVKERKNIKRITILGDGAVGKTSLLRAIKKSRKFPVTTEALKRTPFLNIETLKHDSMTVQCYDLAGQRVENAHPIDLLPKQIGGFIDKVFFVFSLDRFQSFENISKWLELFQQASKDYPIKPEYVLVGNKKDLPSEINETLIQVVIQKNPSFKSYILTSTVTNEGIDKLAKEFFFYNEL